MSRTVDIHYRRLPDRERVYRQTVVWEGSDVIVTLSPPLELDTPLTAGDDVLLEDGSRAVWFTFPGVWHDIGRFHRADGRFSGLYANVLTPPEIDGPTWRTTDLFLDVWWPREGDLRLLDEEELAEALERGDIDTGRAARARAEAERILTRARDGTWPPPVVSSWTLERALAASGPEGPGPDQSSPSTR